jgi:2-polyprenyl-3-methyl-5-hydroxy-6-metoxy-1,4-benzoquinol methylase
VNILENIQFMNNDNGSVFVRAKKNWEDLATDIPLDSILTGFNNDGEALERFYESGEKNIAKILSRVDAAGVILEQNKALDFGCGMGRLTSALANRFKQTWGTDISQTMIDMANSTVGSASCEFEVLTEPGLTSFESNQFDFVISLLVLQHVEPAQQSMSVKELLRVLKPGGVLVVQVPHAPAWSLLGTRLRIMRSLPRFLSRPIRLALGRPERILMNGIKEPKIHKLVQDSGATFLAVDRSTINGWEDRTYFIARSR